MHRTISTGTCGVGISQMVPVGKNDGRLASSCSLRVEGSSMCSCLPCFKITCGIPCKNKGKLGFDTPLSRCASACDGGKGTGVALGMQGRRSGCLCGVAVCPGNDDGVRIAPAGERSVSFSKRVSLGGGR